MDEFYKSTFDEIQKIQKKLNGFLRAKKVYFVWSKI